MFPRISPLATRFKLPFQLSRNGINRVEVAIVGGEVDEPVRDRRRGNHAALGVELPLQCSRLDVNGIKVPIRAANIDHAARYGGTTLHQTAGVTDSPASRHRRV